MNNRVDGIILGGDCIFGLESTVLDLTNDIPVILRPGSITKEDLENVIGEVSIDPALEKKEDNIKAIAPGMKYKHYSPNADVFIVSGQHNDVITKVNELVSNNSKEGLRSVVMCLDENKDKYNSDTISLGKNLQEVAANLFNALITADEEKYDIVYTEEFSNCGLGQAIMNRLIKSAGYKIIKA